VIDQDDPQLRVLLTSVWKPIANLRGRAIRQQSSNHLKQFGLAMHNYHDTYKSFPAPASYGEDGQPLLSWRVHLLPFLEQSDLYRQFHLDEPWDSEHNRALIQKMPRIYRSPASKFAKPGYTTYLLPVAPETVFPGGQGLPIKEIKDGTSNTIMVIEADDDQAVVWTKPDDLEIDWDNPAAGLGGLHDGGFYVGLCDGSSRFIASSIPADTLRALFTRSGGEVIPWSDL
jgi:hypothetical protein